LLNVEQIIPLPEAAEYQVRVRQKERQEREARTQERDTTRFDLVIGEETFSNLPKRKLVYHVVKAAIRDGAHPQEVLPDARCWIIVPGMLSEDEFRQASINLRTDDSSASEIGRFFTSGGELIQKDGKTFALTKMWGTSTLETVNRIISDYKLNSIHYKAVED